MAPGADGKKVGVISTINGDANIGFYKELAAAGVSADTPENKALIEQWHAFAGDPKRVKSDPMKAHVIRFDLRVIAVEKAGTTDVDAVRAAMYGRHGQDVAEPPPDQTSPDR